MTLVTVSRTVRHEPGAIFDLFMDVESFPAYVPGVKQVRRIPDDGPAQDIFSATVGIKSPKYSGTITVRVEGDRRLSRIRLKHKAGPFDLLDAHFEATPVSGGFTQATWSVRATSKFAAITNLLHGKIRTLAEAYADLFIAELDRRANARTS